jgi:hypothetical protein
MKKAAFFLFSILAVAACSDEENARDHTLHVIVQSSFDNDLVEVSVDGQLVMNRRLTTNHTIGLCTDGMISTQLGKGNHTLKVRINNDVQKTMPFLLQEDELFLGVGYDAQSKEIYIQFSLEPFAYD